LLISIPIGGRIGECEIVTADCTVGMKCSKCHADLEEIGRDIQEDECL